MLKIAIFWVVALFLPLAPAWSAGISIASYSGSAGGGLMVPVAFTAQGTLVSAVQLDLEYDSSVMSVSLLLGDAGQSAQKRLYSSDLGAAKKRIMILGLNRNPLADGSLLNLSVSLKTTAPAGNFPLKLSQIVCSDPDGRLVPVAGIDGSVTLQAAPAEAVPIWNDGVVNAASLRSGPIAPGEIITLLGSSIGPDDPVMNPGSAIANTLGGTRVLINGVAAPLLYASSGQINAVVPYALSPGGSTKLLIETQGRKLAELTLPVSHAMPAIFTLDSSGFGQSAVLNEDYSVNSFSNPAPRGSVVSLFVTGAGQTDPAGADAQIADGITIGKPALPVSVQVSGTAAELFYAGASPGLISSLLQVNFRIPDDIVPNLTAPVFIQVGSALSPPGVTIAVR